MAMADERLEGQGGMSAGIGVLLSEKHWDLVLIFFVLALSIEASVVGWWFNPPWATTIAYIVIGALTYRLFFYEGWFRDKLIAWIEKHKAMAR
jgi:hypothetical protein